MNRSDITVIDYGVGNLLSVRRGLERCGATVTVSSNPDEILAATRVVLPGVGAFADAMTELCRRGLDAVVREVGTRGTPLMGICLGMQMLLDASDEFGETAGLGLIPGRVVSIPVATVDGQMQKIPHIGWNSLVLPQGRANWQSTVLQDIKFGEAAYFVHSFMASPNDTSHRIADCLYGGELVSAVIGRGNIVGCQFHPEKSGEVGLKILKRFCAD
ncbi:imidazole glycerol phosphate synthase subunit HisH [Burkholderiaceae bacterium]|nr:imidazole glycerol phosphate synthase subunit HisH [Burkholderiaceae bacterium]